MSHPSRLGRPGATSGLVTKSGGRWNRPRRKPSLPSLEWLEDRRLLATVGDLLFIDSNGNGIQDSGETGAGGATITLFDAGGNGAIGGGDDVAVGSDGTNGQGAYSITGVPAGTYYLQVTLPGTAFNISPKDQGGNDTLDNDFDPTTSLTDVFTLAAATVDNTRDVGIIPRQFRTASGADPASIQSAVDAFRGDLGALNPSMAGSFGQGRREINWDGIPDGSAAPNNLPADFFNVNSPRGVVLSTPGTSFQVSATAASGTPVRFGNINASYTSEFQTFSPQRLFTALGSNVTDVNFFVPGSNTPARVTGFGAVFTDVETAGSTTIEYFDPNGASLGRQVVPTSPNHGLSFVGVAFTNMNLAIISRVRITSGAAALGAPESASDLVVMDDFIYGEPLVPANLVVTKADSPDPVAAGANITYTITLSNTGPGGAQNVTLSEGVPNGTTFVSAAQTSGPTFALTTPLVGGTGPFTATRTTLAAGESATFTFVVNVNADAPSGSTIFNTASVTSSTPIDVNPPDNADSEQTAVVISADLLVTKADSPDPVAPGANITYTITLTNNGPSDAQGVLLSDAVPIGTTFVSATAPPDWITIAPPPGSSSTALFALPTVAAGARSNFTIVVHVADNLPDGSTITNTATASTSTSEPDLANNTAQTTTAVVSSADLAVTKADTPDPVTAGNNLTYTIGLTNAGPSDAQGVVLSDAVPAGTTFVSAIAPAGWTTTSPAVGGTGTVTFTRPTVAAGATPSFTIVVNVGANAASGSTIANTATAATTTLDPNLNNNNASSFTTVNTSADLRVTKTDTPDPVTAGTNLTYSIALTNAGPSDAQNANLSDTLPAGTTFVSATAPAGWGITSPAVGGTGTVSFTTATVAAGPASSFTIVVHVNANVLAGTTITNSATATSSTSDPNSGNNTGSASTAVTASADIAVTKTDSPDPVAAGSNLTYTITVTNNGPSDAQPYQLSDTPPPGTSPVSFGQTSGPTFGGTLPAGSTATFQLIVTVNANVPAGTNLVNSVTATSTTPDPNPANNTATATTTVITSADLAVTKVASPSPVTVGSNLTYTITLTNNGPSDAQGVSLTDGIPAGTTFVSASAPGGWTTTSPAVGGTGTVTFARASFAAGASPTFTIVVQVTSSFNAPAVSNTVSVSSSTTDPNPGNNTATTNTPVNSPVDLVVTKTASPNPVFPGGTLTYTVTVHNAGFAPAANVKLYDLLPDRTTFVSNSGAPGWASVNPPVGSMGIITSTIPSFAGGATANFVIVVRVPTDVRPGTVLGNRAVVTTSSRELNGNNNSTSAQVTVGNPPPGVASAVKSLTAPGGSPSSSLSSSAAALSAQAQDLVIASSSGLVADVLRQKTLSGLLGFGG